jgi:hypothetical protein
MITHTASNNIKATTQSEYTEILRRLELLNIENINKDDLSLEITFTVTKEIQL